ncbi:hypothetical protein BH18THE2_BH18THE2_24850 [soil metagenome]
MIKYSGIIQLIMRGVEGPLQRADRIQILDSIINYYYYYIQDFAATKLSLNRICVYCKLESISEVSLSCDFVISALIPSSIFHFAWYPSSDFAREVSAIVSCT